MVRKSSCPFLAFSLVCLGLYQLVDWLVARLTLTLDTLTVTRLLYGLQQNTIGVQGLLCNVQVAV